ncbi:hypothetical protein ACVIHI_002658 [Bradyrhizobium sp. USDA 4524]|uniref:hypothetical protein n=1 Tax=unclassified Bradyrhizobium TaxID=2631580 RepID=UPI00209EBD6E|nr:MULTISPECIES: hypothetical protein [unclassified Bradyrhizobium]MCP1844421.1 hypothetical protein [Bradyrhizobium sp. USDA 4538]MCP1904987.1 hypothetical protein [Bradyrhizobium sp. USDA 4537]MCP1989357.1 hypothetical protein [Bradyrhizobium sp. USDA 4539]
MTIPRDSIFYKTRYRQEKGQIEFSHFRQLAVQQIPEICQSIDRFDGIRRAFSFWVDKTDEEDRLQINFGTRKMWAKGVDGGTVAERGPRLLYSLSSIDGVVLTALYPATSELGSVAEDHIFLRIGHYGGIDLLDKLRSDLKDLVAYAYVSSLELEPTIADRIRFWWLRKTQPHSIDQKFVRPLTPMTWAASASKFTAAAFLIALLRPVGVLLAYLVLVYLGLAALGEHLH